tara:strand:+ start:29675 stop:30166 length:492 start_codon:yes stop_codon:yes gene_type:complete
MKKITKLNATIFIFLIALNLSAQYDQEIKFDEKKQNKKIVIGLTKDMKSIELNFFSKLEEGHLSIKIYDPENNEKGSFLLFSNKSFGFSTKLGMKIDSLKAGTKWKGTKNNSVKDSIQIRKFKLTGKERQVKKIIKNPMKGRWFIKLTGEKVKGSITASVNII